MVLLTALLYTGLLCPVRGDLLDLTSRFNSTAFVPIGGRTRSSIYFAGATICTADWMAGAR